MSDTDMEQLARYVRDRAEDAFAEIVRRHLGLVYSAALRQVRSPQLAEEVAQSVFTGLAREAGRLRPDTILAAWLYQVAHNTAANVVRGEVRRQMREQIATEMNAMNATAADWTHIEPLLDEAMHALDETDRAAVLLRYFENKSLREVGLALGASENAAQKRLTRAVEHLREFFAKRGATVGASGLVVIISANAIQAAPVGLIATVSSAAAFTGTTVTGASIATTIPTAIVMTTVQKALAGIGVAISLATILITGILIGHRLLPPRTPVAPPSQPTVPMAPVPPPQDVFNLKSGDRLAGDTAPQIAGRAFSITTVFDAGDQGGVIIAQGGLAHGYALYVEAGELIIAVRRNNALTTASAGSVGTGRRTATARLEADGTLNIAIEGRGIGAAKAAGVITSNPVDVLDVGTDTGGLVGLYPAGFAFGGTIESITLRLE